MRAIKLNGRSSFAVFCVLVSFIIPVTALAVDCPCFTAEEVMRYASHPAKFVCILPGSQGGVRLLIKGEYAAGFGVSADDYPNDNSCSAYVGIGDGIDEEPRVVFLERYFQVPQLSLDEWRKCGELIELGDPPFCE